MKEKTYGTNYFKPGGNMMLKDELSVINSCKCILQLRGIRSKARIQSAAAVKTVPQSE